MRTTCGAGAHLLVYDYSRPRGMELPKSLGTEFENPIVVEEIDAWMMELNWKLVSVENWTDRYLDA